MRTIVVGTAGHIDHGKTTLVRALTGVETDRLAEEKRRGISIELGFAAWQLHDNLRASVIDVPGHQRLVRTMVAGAGGLDLVMLVVAADDGVMPQTREHLDVLDLLGVRAGVVVVTKVDRLEAEDELLELAEEEIRETLVGTFLHSAPVVRVSCHKGVGLEALRQTVAEVAAGMPARQTTDAVVLPVDRVFTKAGFGVIATGTTMRGSIDVSAALEAFDVRRGGLSSFKVRGVHVLGQDCISARAGMRTAVNLVGKDPVRPGMVLAAVGRFLPSRHLIADLRVLPTATAVGDRRLWLHIGTTVREVQAVPLADEKTIAAGERGMVLLRAREPLVAFAGQHFVLRRPGAHGQGTVAGGEIIDPLAPFGRGSIGAGRRIAAAATAEDSIERRLVEMVSAAKATGASEAELGQRLPETARQAALTRMRAAGRVIAVAAAAGERYVSAVCLAAIEERLLSSVLALHDEQPMAAGLSSSVAQSRLPAPEQWLTDVALQRLVDRRAVVRDGVVVGIPGRGTAVSAEDRVALDRVLHFVAAGGEQPPSEKELASHLATSGKRVGSLLNLLRQQGQLLRISPELHYQPDILASIEDKLVHALRDDGALSASQLKEALGGVSRKFAIPLLEYFDKNRVTVRQGDKRRLHPARRASDG